MTKKGKVDIEVKFPFKLHREDVAGLVIDLFKSILHQRNQIPLQYEQLLQNLNRDAGRTMRDVTNTKSDVITSRKVLIREQKEERRKRKAKEKFSKRASNFVESCEEFLGELKKKIEEEAEDILSVRFAIGATPVSPKTTYRVVFPPQLAEQRSQKQRPGPHLFRAMMGNEDLLRISSVKLPVKNVYVYIEKKTCQTTEKRFIQVTEPRTNMRGSLVQINLTNNNDNENSPSSRNAENPPRRRSESADGFKIPGCSNARLRFDSGSLQTPGPRRQADPVGVDAMTPVTMELCTPSVYKPSSRNKDLVVQETPVIERNRLNSLRKRAFWMLEGDAVTDAVQRERKWSSGDPGDPMELCTPAVLRHRRSSGSSTKGVYCSSCTMEFCTPAVLRHRRSSESSTNGIYQSTLHNSCTMEFCTPAVLCHRRSSESSTNGVYHSSCTMDLCTPYVQHKRTNVVNKSVQKIGVYKGASLESATPSVLKVSSCDSTVVEACTPCVHRRTSSGSTETTRQSRYSCTAMELCTPGPAVHQSITCTAMDPCTPGPCSLGNRLSDLDLYLEKAQRTVRFDLDEEAADSQLDVSLGTASFEEAELDVPHHHQSTHEDLFTPDFVDIRETDRAAGDSCHLVYEQQTAASSCAEVDQIEAVVQEVQQLSSIFLMWSKPLRGFSL